MTQQIHENYFGFNFSLKNFQKRIAREYDIDRAEIETILLCSVSSQKYQNSDYQPYDNGFAPCAILAPYYKDSKVCTPTVITKANEKARNKREYSFYRAFRALCQY